MLRRTTFREIRSTFGRYIAIFAIIALGVGFLIGLRVTNTAFKKTADVYVNEYSLFDMRLISTLGLTDDDVSAIAAASGVKTAEGAVYQDVVCDGENGDYVLRFHSLTENVNKLKLLHGRMPEKADECVADAAIFSDADIGRTIKLSPDNKTEAFDNMAHDEYMIVGIADSVYYMNYERGTTSAGAGRVSGFAFIMPDGFDTEYWMEIFLTLDETGYIYSDEYEAAADKAEDWLTELLEERADIRYNDIYDEADGEISDAERELADGWEEYRTERADAERELEDARLELEDAERKIADGWDEYYDGAATLERETRDAENELRDAETELADALQKLNDGETEYADGLKEYEDALVELADAEKKLEDAYDQLLSANVSISIGYNQLMNSEESYNQLVSLNDTVTMLRTNLSAYFPFASNSELIGVLASGTAPMLNTAVDTALTPYGMDSVSLVAAWQAVEAEIGEPLTDDYIAGVRRQLDLGWADYYAGSEAYVAGIQEYEKGKKELEEGRVELENGKKELDDARIELDDGWKEYNDGIVEVENGWTELREETQKAKRELADAYAELKDGEAEYADGLEEYNDAYAEAMEEFADAEAELHDAEIEIADAREELSELEYPEVFVLGRDTNIGYVCFENDVDILNGISRVFPLFFFLVAALVCITTMTRMVDEQRTQIGVLKALGFKNFAIMGKFLAYSGSASVLGCLFGFMAGSIVFPTVLWKVYSMMYGFADLILVFDVRVAASSVVLYMVCAYLSTWSACRSELICPPAELIRPKAPKSGKRIILEYMPFLWKRMNFFQKVSARNILRYWKRLFMMVLGVGGCTALLLTGFGIFDSIRYVADYQYDEITLYDASISFSEVPDTELREKLETHENTEKLLYLHESTADVMSEEVTKTATLVVFAEDADMFTFTDLHNENGAIPLPRVGEVVVNNELASRLGVAVGDQVTVRDGDSRMLTLTVSGVFENYMNNYVYISAGTYEELAGTVPEFKTAYINFVEGVDHDSTAASIMDEEGVSAVTLSKDTRGRINTTLESLVYIVILVVVCAGALAFIVIYNLTNINITERIREIATIKVLGFTPRETAAYVFRENLVESLLGAAVGLVGGKYLHMFVMSQVRVDAMSFDLRIATQSYIFSICLTVVFSLLVDLFMRPKLNRINMAESLKSIE